HQPTASTFFPYTTLFRSPESFGNPMMRETDLKGITRRSLLSSAGASVAGMLLAEHSLCAAQSSSTTTTTPGNISASFASLKQIDAGLLNVGYAEVGAPTSF